MNRILVNEQHEFDVEMEDILQINGEEVDFSWFGSTNKSFMYCTGGNLIG